VQLLFHQYEKNNNSYFFYEELFKDLKSIYHNRSREKFLENLYVTTTEELGRFLKLNDLKTLYNPKVHQEFLPSKSVEELIQDFSEFVEVFQSVYKLNKKDNNVILSKEIFNEFFKFFGFGIENDQTFFELVADLFSGHPEQNENEVVIKDNKNFNTVQQSDNINENNIEDKSIRNSKYSDGIKYNTYDNNNNDHKEYIQLKNELNPLIIKVSSDMNKNSENIILNKLIKNLQSYGRKCLFSLIKHFKYYDNRTQFVNKFDFAKIMKDFRLNLTITEIEKLFLNFSNKNEQLNYVAFIKTLTERSFNEDRKFLIQQIYEKLRKVSAKKSVDLKILKSVYNPKNHPIRKEEDEIYAEYFECMEMFQYSYKNRRVSEISYEDFEEFYRFIGFLTEDDEMFKRILHSEWKNVINKNEEKQKIEEETKSNNKRNEDKSVTTKHDIRMNHQQRPITPVSPDRSARSTTPIQKTLNANDKETALVQNQYLRKIAVKPIVTKNPMNNLKEKLKKRGIRGLMNLHKQFLLNCSNINAISYGDFIKVLKLQRIELSKEENQDIFDKFSSNNQFLNFSSFIRNFKKILSSVRLECVEKAFTSLDIDCTEMLSVDDIKLKFNAASHPDVMKNNRSEDDVIVEFLDCFELNYNFLVCFYIYY
jgi:hypothetical protein